MHLCLNAITAEQIERGPAECAGLALSAVKPKQELLAEAPQHFYSASSDECTFKLSGEGPA